MHDGKHVIMMCLDPNIRIPEEALAAMPCWNLARIATHQLVVPVKIIDCSWSRGKSGSPSSATHRALIAASRPSLAMVKPLQWLGLGLDSWQLTAAHILRSLPVMASDWRITG